MEAENALRKALGKCIEQLKFNRDTNTVGAENWSAICDAEEALSVEYYRSLDLRGFSVEELKTLRAKINGKIGRRKITPEAQAKMQAGRKKKPD